MTYIERYQEWIAAPFTVEQTKKELQALSLTTDAKDIEDRFYKELEFGTGGLRGIMGAGTNRVNRYTIGKATTGLGNYLKDHYTAWDLSERGVVIGYDTRNNSEYLAEVSADVLTAMGIKVLLFSMARPTPEVSFTVKYRNCIAGIVLTASHNPKEYNGYKVYDENGCQLVPAQAKSVISYVNKITDYSTIVFTAQDQLKTYIDVTVDYVREVYKQSLNKNQASKSKLKVVYTPIHGTGTVPVLLALTSSGFDTVEIVAIQEKPDGNFPTVYSPNPEDPKALELGIQQAKDTNADIVLGTDPDADRVGVAVQVDGEYKLLTGNQIGALLVDYVVRKKDLRHYQNPALVKTEVTSELGANIARKHGLDVYSTLTGFKFIGEKIDQFEEKGIHFIIGYEESYGYLAGTHARDKDAVVASLLICEMAAEYKQDGFTLFDRLEQIYQEYGYYNDHLDAFTLKGKDGIEMIQSMMVNLRKEGSPYEDSVKIIDYMTDVEAEPGFDLLPKSDVIKYILADGSWVAVRPSGTEPKIKIYYSVTAETYEETKDRLKCLQKIIITRLGLENN